MSTQILATKLYIPVPRPGMVLRPRLLDRLNAGLHGKLTFISAPAGFGKTTLATAWIAADERPVAWISLDEGDSDPIRFLSYIVAALQTIAPQIDNRIISLLESLQPPPLDSLLTLLLNEIATMPHDFVLVLDDYHALDSTEIDSALTFLIDNQPPQMHLVLTTREDPRLPLARLRVQGQLTELRAADLRFTPDEAAAFLNTTMGLNLSSDDVVALEQRTEGWIAGLQLAAISMQGQQDVGRFIQSFTGSHRFIVDYLVEEVLNRQPDHVRDFLFQTSILERLSASLCDAVTGRDDGQMMIEQLERSNMLIVPLDDQRQWYRYHHLFAEVLQTYARKADPDQIPILHRRACDWYAMNNQPYEALHHVFVIEDYERAAVLIELNWQQMNTNYASAAWISQVHKLPESIIRRYPVLCAGHGWTLLYRGEFEASDGWFQQAEHWLNTDERDEMCVADPFQFEMLPASLNSARAYQSLARGDTVTTLQFAQQALNLVGDADHASRTQALAASGLAQWTNGDLSDADATISSLIDYMEQAGRIADALELMFVIGDIRTTCGRLRSAYRLYQRGFEMLAAANGANLIGMEDLYRGVVDVYREWGDWNAAEYHLRTAETFGSQSVNRPDWHHRLNITAARLALSRREFDRALELAKVAEDHYTHSPIPAVRSAAGLRARVWIKQGNLSAAVRWAQENSVDQITYLNEFEHITHARLLIAQSESKEAMTLLERLHTAARAGGRNGSLIEIMTLQSLAHAATGDPNSALGHLNQALTLAEPEGYIRVFVDEGEAIQPLLAHCLSRGEHVVYVKKLLDALQPHSADKSPNQLLIEPLSEREIEVLSLLTNGYTNQAIADELFIALSTVKKHINNIYGKLNVASRTQAINRARDLGILN